MMYNQPSKYYAQAQEQVKILGLSKQKVSFSILQLEIMNKDQ